MNLIYTRVYATAHYFIQTLNHHGVRGVRRKINCYHEKYIIEPRVHVCFERNNLDTLRDRNGIPAPTVVEVSFIVCGFQTDCVLHV